MLRKLESRSKDLKAKVEESVTFPLASALRASEAGRLPQEIEHRYVSSQPYPISTSGSTSPVDIDMRQYVTPLLRWWWLILVSLVVGTLSGYMGARATPRVYQARTTLMVGQALQNPDPSQSDVYMGQMLAQSYADLVKREPVLQGTLDALGLKWDWIQLQRMVSSRVIPGTQLLEISLLDTDPQRAKILTDEIAHQLILSSPAAADPQKEANRQFILKQTEDLKANIQQAQDDIRQLDDAIAQMNSARQIQDARSRQVELQTQITTWQATYAQMLTNLQQGTPNFLSVVEPARVPSLPVSTSAGTNVLLGAVIGLVLAGGAAYLLEYIDDTIKTAEDVRKVLGMTALGAIPLANGANGSGRLVTLDESRSPVAAAYRVLRTNLQFSSIDRPFSTIMITSTSPEEGKSVTAANLAVTMAQSDKQVILVDADLWRPVQHEIFQLKNEPGLTTLMRGDTTLAEALQPGPIENLRVLPAGLLPPNPSDLLSSRRLQVVIAALQQQADVVIFDSPPLAADADAQILATRVDGVLLVVDSGRTRRAAARRGRDALAAVGAHMPGIVLNRVPDRGSSYYYYLKDGQRHDKRSPRELLVTRLKQDLDTILARSRMPGKRIG